MKITDSATIIASITAYFYCSSTAYNRGYLSKIGLNSELLDSNFHQAIYQGMILNIYIILYLPLALFIAILIHGTYKIELSRYVNKNFKNGRKIRKLKKTLAMSTKKNPKTEIKYKTKIYFFAFILFAIVTFMFLMHDFEKRGVESASILMIAIEDKKHDKIKYQSSELAYLYCGARNCAGYSIEEKEILYFPQTGHSYLKELKPNKTKK